MFAIAAIYAGVVLHGYALGMAHGLLSMTFVLLFVMAFHAVTGADGPLSGAWAEDNTRDALKSAKRKRRVLGWVDNLETLSGDVDHLVIARSGALLSLDSKWHAETNPTLCQRDTEAARRAARNAHLILKSLGHDQPVIPVVVMWGGAQSDLPAEHLVVGGVDVVQGRHLARWLEGFSTPTGDRAQLASLKKDLLRFRQRVQPTRRLA